MEKVIMKRDDIEDIYSINSDTYIQAVNTYAGIIALRHNAEQEDCYEKIHLLKSLQDLIIMYCLANFEINPKQIENDCKKLLSKVSNNTKIEQKERILN